MINSSSILHNRALRPSISHSFSCSQEESQEDIGRRLKRPTTPIESIQRAQEERRRVHHEADVVVVGAGIFGCAVAFAFAKQGRSVILLERWMKEPDRIVGEYLQPGGCRALEKLGMLDCLDGIDAVRMKGYQIQYYGEPVKILYPRDVEGAVNQGFYDTTKGEIQRPEGRSFHHGRFITKLRGACKNEPNITMFETEVTDLIKNETDPQVLGVKTTTKDPRTGEKEPDCFFAQLTVIADGYASKFQKQYIKNTPVAKSKFYALELIDCPVPLPNHGHVILGDAEPVLLYQIGTHETRALIDIPENLPAASLANGGVRAYIRDVIVPSLPKQVQQSFIDALSDGKIPRSMPNSWLGPSTQQEKGMVILGDAMNMRHPLTGGGMTVAFNDVVLLSELLSPERVPSLADTAAVQKAMKEFHWKRKGLSSVINILAQALYTLFAAAASDKRMKTLQEGCFHYLCKGGVYQEGPIGLLGGIIKSPIVLVYHFFAVAVFSLQIVWRNAILSIGDLWKVPLALLESLLVLYRAAAVIFPYMMSEIRP